MSRLSAGAKVAIVLMFCAVCTVPALLAQAAAPRWSWEETLQPLDILEFVSDLPYDEWVEIDEVTVRRLFEDVIGRALGQMEIVGEGGLFEQVIRRNLLYFTPEFEYYWPAYEEDASERVARFPVQIIRKGKDGLTNSVTLRLGRERDDEREINMNMVTLGSGQQIMRGLSLTRERYVVGAIGRPKKQVWNLAWRSTEEYKEVHLYVEYFNHNYSIWKLADEPVLVFRQGNSDPVEINGGDELLLELSGVDVLFAPYIFDTVYENWEPYDASYPQTMRGLIDLCKLQLGLAESGRELEMLLRKHFLEFTPWGPMEPERFDPFREPAYEFVSIRRESRPDPDVVVYHFDIGDIFSRDVYVVFSREAAVNIEYGWAIKLISFIQPAMVEYVDRDGQTRAGVGSLTRLFLFHRTPGYMAGIDPRGIAATYEAFYADPRGYVLTPVTEQLIAYFSYGDPRATFVR